MAKQLGFLVNADLCIGCHTCGMACKNQYHQAVGIVWRQLIPLPTELYPHEERAWFSLACNHCANPACVAACPTDAISKREEDGIVILDMDKCEGYQDCIKECPYNAPKYDPALEKSSKCHLCYERVDAGLNPACVQSCPTGALQFIEIDTFDEPDTMQYPPGLPRREDVNPSVRFKFPAAPKVIRRYVEPVEEA